MAKFIIVRADQQREVEFDKQEIVVGREEGCEIYLPDDAAISRLHCKIVQREGNFVVIDLNSKNGTYVNGQRITEKVLEIGDKIKVGKTKIYFQQRIPPKHVWKYVLPEDFSIWAKTKTRLPVAIKVVIFVVIVVLAVIVFKNVIQPPEEAGKQQNLLKEDLKYWQIARNAIIKPTGEGRRCIFMEIQPEPGQYISQCTYKQKITVKGGDVFEAGCYARAEELRGRVYIEVTWFCEDLKLLEEASPPFSISDKREWFSSMFISPPYATHMQLSLVVLAKGGRIYFDTIRLARSEEKIDARLANAGKYKLIIGQTGSLAILREDRIIFSNLFFGLKSYRDGFSPQIFCEERPAINQIKDGIELKGNLLNPVNLKKISYLQKITCSPHGFQINYEFSPVDIRFLDEFVMNLFVPDVSHLPEVKQICKQVPLYQGGNEILLIFNTPVKIDLMWAKNVYVKTGLKIGPDFSSSGLSVKETVIDWRMVEKLQGIAIQLYDEQRLGEAYKKFRKLYHLTADVGKKRFAKKKMNEILQTFERQKHEMQRLLNSVLISLNPRLIDLLEEKKKQYCKKFKGLEGVELISKRCEEVEGILRRLDLSKAEQRAKALLNLGRIFYGQKKFVMAEDILKSIVKNYPQTEAFSEALDLLQKIKEQ